MAIQLGNAPAWRKSKHSAGNGACVEVASPAPLAVAVRDSKDPHGPVLTFSPESWTEFVADIDRGVYNID